MAIDRAGARRRVRTITGWVAAGAAAVTAGAAFGAARGSHAATTTTPSNSPSPDAATQDALPQAPQSPYSNEPPDQQGFVPPSASAGPPAGMSGGS